MGSGIAQVSAMAGFDTIVREISDAVSDKSRLGIEKVLAKGIERGKVTSEQKDSALAKLSFTTDLGALAGCDIIIEAVDEDLQMKNEMWKDLNEVCPETIFASNTSSLTIAAMAAPPTFRRRRRTNRARQSRMPDARRSWKIS